MQPLVVDLPILYKFEDTEGGWQQGTVIELIADPTRLDEDTRLPANCKVLFDGLED